jgi:predicted PurR-regulated permease PerM
MTNWSKENVRRSAGVACLAAVAVIFLYLCYLIGKPFLTPVVIAIMFGIVFYPLHSRIQSHLNKPNLAATLSTTLVFLLASVPVTVLGFAISRELGEIMESLREHGGAGTASPYVASARETLLKWIGAYVDLSKFDPYAVLLRWTEQASRYVLSFGAALVSNLFTFVFDTVAMFFSLFFLFREGPRISGAVSAILPVDHGQTQRLFKRISETMIGGLYGSLAVGAAQGFLTGLAFWVLGISAPILWAMLTGLASLVPVVGSALIWGPAALLLALTGHWVRALILLVWGALVVGQIDVVIRPYIVSSRVKIHSLLIFFALLGGVEAFGVIGIFVGPLVLTITLALWDVLRTLDWTWQAEPSGAPQIVPDAKRP